MSKGFVIAVAFLTVILLGSAAMALDRSIPPARNVLGQKLEAMPGAPAGIPAGFYRDGYCNTGPDDAGQHVVAATVTDKFLAFTRLHGNDLQTPRPESNFPGLKPGDGWCVCAARWKEAEAAGAAPPVNLGATHESATSVIPLATLKKYQQKP